METPQSSRHRSRRSSIGIEEAPFQTRIESFETILSDLHEVGYTTIEMSDLVDVRKEKIRNLYLFLLEICAGVNEEKIQQRAMRFQASCAELEFAKDLHPASSFVEAVFYSEFKEVIAAAGFEKFSFRDLYSPDPKRLRHILSCVLNYCRFRDRQVPVYAKLHAERNMLIETYETLQDEKEAMLEQRAYAMEEAEARNKQIEELAEQCEQMEQVYLKMNAQQSNDRNMATEARKESAEICDKTEVNKWEAEKIQETIRHVEATQLAKSPERKTKLCQDRKEALDVIKAEHAQLLQEMERVSTLVHRAQHYKAPLAEISTLTSQVANLQKEIGISKEKQSKLERDIGEVDAELVKTEDAIRDEEHTLARLQYQLEHQDEETQPENSEEDLLLLRKEALEKEERTRQRLVALKAQFEQQEKDQRRELEECEAFHQTLIDEFEEKLKSKMANIVTSQGD